MIIKNELIKDPRTGVEYSKLLHSSGLTVYVMELKGFSSTSALFGTKYGSINTVFKTDVDSDFVHVPEGIAHFLEHKLFENEDCPVYEEFAKTGAAANAYTSFDRTVYYFDCTDNFSESLGILLDFVRKPYFTKESVDKEQGIIGQEIKMCEDNPYRRVYFNLLRAVYKNHPVRTEIAGTVDSISNIDAELLYRCYNAFYSLQNMVLSVAGNCTLDEVIAVCDRVLGTSDSPMLETVFPDEPEEVSEHETVEKMDVAVPIFSIGYKAPPSSGIELLKNEYASMFLMSMIFGRTSRFFAENTRSGLIDQSFETETDDGEGYFMNAATGESRDPREVMRLMNLEIERVRREGLSEDEFFELKKSRYGGYIRLYNNVPASAANMLSAHMSGVGVFDPVEVLANMTLSDVTERLPILLNPENCAISIIEPEN